MYKSDDLKKSSSSSHSVSQAQQYTGQAAGHVLQQRNQKTSMNHYEGQAVGHTLQHSQQNASVTQLAMKPTDWALKSKVSKSGKRIIFLDLKVALLNSSKSKFNMAGLQKTVEQQIKNSYNIKFKEPVAYHNPINTMKLDRPPNYIYPPPTLRDVEVKTSVTSRIIKNASGVKGDEHLIEILGKGDSRIKGLYGKANKIGGKIVYLNEKYVSNMISGADMNTIPHELGHTLGLLHIDVNTHIFRFLGYESEQYLDESKQINNKNNAMFSGSSKYMNDKTSTKINPSQILEVEKLFNDGELNKK